MRAAFYQGKTTARLHKERRLGLPRRALAVAPLALDLDINRSAREGQDDRHIVIRCDHGITSLEPKRLWVSVQHACADDALS